MYYSAIGLLAAVVLLIENRDILLLRYGVFDTPAWRAYRWFLVAVLVYYVTDILWGVFESQRLGTLLFLDTTVYFIAMAMGVLLMTRFVVAYLGEEGGSGEGGFGGSGFGESGFGRFLLYTGSVFCGAVIVAVVVNGFIPILFSVDAQCVYHALDARYVQLVTQIVLLVLMSAYTFWSMRRVDGMKAGRYRAIAFFSLMMAIFLTAQIWYPYLPLYTVAYLLGTCLLHSFVIRGEREEYEMGMIAAEARAHEAAKIAELQQSMASLFNNIPGISFSKDAETGVYLACNQAFAEYAHKDSPEGVIGLTDEQIFDPETARHFVEDDRMALSMDEPYIFFEDVRDAAGKQKQFQTTKLKFTDSLGRVCTLGMSSDVTDMVRIQREYATTKEDYERERSAGIMHAHIAQALAHGYENLFYVDIESGEFVEYRIDDKNGAMREVRRGQHFFDACKQEAGLYVHPNDQANFLKALDRQRLMDASALNDAFMMTYRLMQGGESRYVSMRVTHMDDDGRLIVIGVTDIDEETKQSKAAERAAEERATYVRINALSGDFLCIYTVDLETDHYVEYSATKEYDTLLLPKEGTDFFRATIERGRSFVHPEDLDRFLSLFSRSRVLSEIEQNGMYSLRYRILLNGAPLHVWLKAAMVEEKDGPRLVVGMNDVDTIVRQEEEHSKRLSQALSQANLDALTGVKNKHAYLVSSPCLFY